jgi:TetR/AcrR family transcriptional regulator, regulator of cefoperazone and chloramphenicol sensitivity
MDPQDHIKARLLEAAGEEFATNGFEAAGVRAICCRAGANVAAVNYYFGGKEQLYVAAVLDAHRCGSGGDEEIAAERSAPEQLRCFIHHFLNRVLAINHPDDWRYRLMLREMTLPTQASDTLVREAIRPKFERLQAILQQICPDADERKLNALSFTVIGQCLHYRMARPVAERLVGKEAFAALDLDYLTQHITSFCLAALGCRAPLDVAGDPVPDAAVAAD